MVNKVSNLTGPEKGLGLEDKNKHDKDQPVNENLLKCQHYMIFLNNGQI